MWRWTKRALAGVVALLLLAALGTSYQWLSTRRDLAATPPPGQLVDIGGYRLHLWCMGAGALGSRPDDRHAVRSCDRRQRTGARREGNSSGDGRGAGGAEPARVLIVSETAEMLDRATTPRWIGSVAPASRSAMLTAQRTQTAGSMEPPTRTDVSAGLRLDPLDDARFAPGRIFASRYRIVSLLGRGAMGEVYRADDLRLGQSVALKLMSEAIARRHDGLQRLTDEVRLARGIAHPNVCRVYDIGYAEGWHYLSMEYVDGETLASLLRRIGQPLGAKGLEMARQLSAGLGAAHARGVLHRDLKPTNIMIDGRGQVRILDFGLAVAAADDVREVAGTPAYMSPEQRAGERITIRSDLYALGRVLTELLPADIDAELSRMIHACLAHDPAKRPDSANAIAAAIPGDALRLSEGGIPTPAMVAAAPTTGAIRPSVAWLLLGASLSGSVAIASRAHLINVAPSELPKPPAVLAERAREIAAARRTVDPGHRSCVLVVGC